MTSFFKPQKPSTPPLHARPARRHVVVTPASATLPQKQGRKRSKSSPSVIVSTSSESSVRSTPAHVPPDLQERQVCFQEAPEIVLFLSDPDEGRVASLPLIRPLAPIAEEAQAERPQRDQTVGANGSISLWSTLPHVGGTPDAPGRPRPSRPSPQESYDGGLSAISKERRIATSLNLFHTSPQTVQ